MAKITEQAAIYDGLYRRNLASLS